MQLIQTNRLALVTALLSLAVTSLAQPEGGSKRVPWDGSRMNSSPIPSMPLTTVLAFPNLKFQEPVEIRYNALLNRFFVLEVRGRIFSFPPDPTVKQPDLAYNLPAYVPGTTRAYGLEFHPEFATNGEVFLCYVFERKREDGTHVARFRIPKTDGPPRFDPDSREVLITWLSGGHNGGSLNFGPDGMLYISTGDAEAPYPPDGLKTGQDISDLLASILRIDVDRQDGGRAYHVPPDNPFVDRKDARPEVWAYGFRNPWKMSFDMQTGDLWVGDVGWDLWELVFKVERGGNYGWSIMEGSQPIHPEDQPGPTPITAPVVQHSHTEARSMTGGYVYHGNKLPDLKGAYIYGDYTTGRIWGLRYEDGKVIQHRQLANTPHQVICFGIGPEHELLVVDYLGGIHKLVPKPANKPSKPFPARLSETGLFADLNTLTPADGVIPYSINAGPWQDGARSDRFIAIPGSESIELHTVNNPRLGYFQGDWRFPDKTVLVKTISMDVFDSIDSVQFRARKLETQMLQLHEGFWQAYSFIWNEDGTEAILSDGQGADLALIIPDVLAPSGRRELNWHFASRAECQLCHGIREHRNGTINAFKPEQLTGKHTAVPRPNDQLKMLQQIGIINKMPRDPKPPLANPYDNHSSLSERARSYLHTNCAHCHHQGGGGATVFDLSHHLPFKRTRLEDLPPAQGDFGLDDAEVLSAGDPYCSVLLYRMAKLGNGRMPHLGSRRIDVAGLKVVHDWIAGMAADEKTTQFARRRKQNNSRRNLVESLAKGQPADQASSLAQLLERTSSALMLQQAILGNSPLGQFPAAQRESVIRGAAAHENFQVRDLFEQLLPDSERVKRLGPKPDTARLLARAGSPAKGRRLFNQAGLTLCVNCHRVQGIGKHIGPDLSRVGARLNHVQMLESLLEPSRTISDGFRLYLLEMKTGEPKTGFLLEREKEITRLRLLSGEEITLHTQAVKSITDLPTSPMPPGLLQNLTLQEAADLLAYLNSLR